MTITPVNFPGGALSLEGMLCEPPGERSRALLVVCHPHPQRGGDMHNNAVIAIVRAAYDLGLRALTFNFRGVGESEGAFDGGGGEKEDVRAAVAFARAQPGAERVILAGYSFGAGRAAAVVDESIAALLLVSPPASQLAKEPNLAAFNGPVLLVAGDSDHIASPQALAEAGGVPVQAATVVSVPGVDHFWWGQEAILTGTVGDFIRSQLS
jgi:alpha/beta superfamily hydrolase